MLIPISFQPIWQHSLFEACLITNSYSSILDSILLMAIFMLKLEEKFNKAGLGSSVDGCRSCKCSYSTFGDAYWMIPLESCRYRSYLGTIVYCRPSSDISWHPSSYQLLPFFYSYLLSSPGNPL